MTRVEAEGLLAQNTPMVKIKPNGKVSSLPYFMGGVLVEVRKRTALVIPAGHKRPVELTLDLIKDWKSRNRIVEQKRRPQ